MAICAVTWIMSPGSKPHEEEYHSTPRASRSSMIRPRRHRCAAATPRSVDRRDDAAGPTCRRSYDGCSARRKSPRLASFSTGVAPIPDYMKPKRPRSRDQSVNGIAYKATTFDGAKSFTIADQSLVLPPQPITCIMDTMVVTGASGEAPFQCHLEHDVLSPTSVVLMEAGTQVLGYYKSIVTQGENRVVAITAHARTPNGVVVPLGGPVADELGAAGVEGSVDNHWGARLGGALLLSLVDSGVSLGQSALSKDGSTSINLNSGSGGGVGIAVTAGAGADHQHPPDDHTAPGHTRALWVTKFIDFSGSYRAGVTPMRRNEALEHLIQPFVPFLANPATTEIVVNRPGEFGVEANGQWSWHTEESLTFDRLDAIGVLTAFRASREFNPSNPEVATTLPGGERLQACRAPATFPETISLTIRKPTRRKVGLDDDDVGSLLDGTNAAPAGRTKADARPVEALSCPGLARLLSTGDAREEDHRRVRQGRDRENDVPAPAAGRDPGDRPCGDGRGHR